MAQAVLIMGESGTGKSTSMRTCSPETTAIVNPVGKALPFKGKYTTLSGETDARKICKFMCEQAQGGKKLLVVDDFQYILSIPYMERIHENGWEKWRDFGANYYDIIEVCKELPEDVVVAYMTHSETLESGVTTIKLIGKLLREKITIEGLFTTVLRTGVNEGKYYFYTQNSGKDTVKTPMGMFPSYAIDNDLNYVADKIRNFYEVGEYKTDAEMQAADVEVGAQDIERPTRRGRGRGSKTHDEVVAENRERVKDNMAARDEAIETAAAGREEIPFDEAMDAAEGAPQQALEEPPRRTHRERKATVLEADTYYYVAADDNYVMKHAGDAPLEDGEIISKEEYGKGIKRLAQTQADTDTVATRTSRTRKAR